MIGLLVLTLSVAQGCGKDDGKGGGAKKDPAADFKLESVQGDITEIKAALAAGEDAKYKCAGGMSYAEGFTTSTDEATKKAGDEITKLCGYDVPMLAATQEVAKAEAARKAEPDSAMLSECYNAMWDMAKEELARGFKDNPAFVALTKRWDVACPPKAK